MTTLATIEGLEEIFEFVERVCQESGMSQSDVFVFRLAADEICTNIIKHSYRGAEPGPITLSIDSVGDRVVMKVGDHGKPFDPDDAPAADLVSEWEKRRVGGLGLHLLRQLMDEVRYETDAVLGNCLTVARKAGETHGSQNQ